MPVNSIRSAKRSAKRRQLKDGRPGRPSSKYDDLRVITCNLPELDLAFIDKFIINGIVSSRSEYIRIALRRSIERDCNILQTEIEVVDDKRKLDPNKFVRVPGYNGGKPVKIIRRLN